MDGLRRIRLEFSMSTGAETDVHALAGRILSFLTKQQELKRLDPMRVFEGRVSVNGSEEWELLDYKD